MNTDSGRVAKFRGVSLFLLMVLSTVAGPMVQSQEPEATVEFATSGDFLLLDATERVVIGVDMDTLLNSNNLNDAISSVSSLDGAHNGVLTGITHDESNLYLTYSDGVIEEYENHGGEDDFAHWVLSEVDTLNPPATSVDLHSSILYWTNEGDSTVYSMHRSLFGLTWNPVERVLVDPTYSGGLSGIVVSDDLEGPDRVPVISVLDDSGSTVLVTDQELSSEASVAGERLWARDGEPVRAIEEVKVNQSGTEQTVLIALDGDSLRILERKEASSQLHIFSASVDSEEANYSSQNYASTGVANNELREYTVLQFSNTQLNSNNRCFPLRITFDELTPFTYEDRNITKTGGSITLSIGGVEKTVTHEEISNQTLLWGPENNDELIPDMCVQTSSTVDFTIVDWEPTNLVANIVLSEPETVPVFGDENSSYPTSWSRSDITWSKGTASVATPRASDSVEVFGDHVFEEITGIPLLIDSMEVDGTTGRMWYPTFGTIIGFSLLNLNTQPITLPERIETVVLESVKPIQSVWDPSLYTQEKDMFWEIDLSYQLDNPLLHAPRKMVTVELLTQGTECNMNGVDCPKQFRLKDTWEHVPLLEKWMKTLDQRTYEDVRGEYFDEVNVLRFQIDLESAALPLATLPGQTTSSSAKVVIPFAVSPENHQNGQVQPAEAEVGGVPNPQYMGQTVSWGYFGGPYNSPTNLECPNYPECDDDDFDVAPYSYVHTTANSIERGLVRWKVVVDPDNDLNEDSEEREDNSKGWNSPEAASGEVDGHGLAPGEEHSIPFGDMDDYLAPYEEDDNFRILVIRTQLIFNECDDWATFYADDWYDFGLAWNRCNDRNHQVLDPPSAAWTEEMLVYARTKMQEMFPFPEPLGHESQDDSKYRLQIDLLPNVMTHEKTESETIIDYVGQVMQRTTHAFDLIDRGVNIADLNNYDRVVFLTHADVADGGAIDDWDDRMFGIFNFAGFCPCSKAVIVTQANNGYMRDTAETLIHEIAHSMLVGHDNEGGLGMIFNNCGHPNAYDWDIPGGKGWSPVNFGSNPIDKSQEIYLDGQSFMRYPSDGQNYDGTVGDYWFDNHLAAGIPYDPNDYGFANSWIQDIDYGFIQRNYDFDAGGDYLDEYWSLVWDNLWDQIAKYVKDFVMLIWDGAVWIVKSIWNIFVESWKWVYEETIAPKQVSNETISRDSIRFSGYLSPDGNFIGGHVDPSRPISAWDWASDFILLDSNYTFTQLNRDGETIIESPVNEFVESRDNLNGITELVAIDAFDEKTVAWKLIDDDGNVVTTGTIPQLSSFNVTGAQSTSRGDSINLSWGASVTEGLTYDLTLISEGTLTETPLAKGLTRPWIELDTNDWGRDTYQLVVKASDGFREITEMSNEFSVTGIDHEISWVSSSLAAPGEDIMMVIDYFDDINSFARSTEMNCTYTADDWNVQVMDSLGNRVLLSMSVRNDASFADVRPQIVVDCAGHPPNYISHPVSISVKGPVIDLDDVADVFDDLDVDLDADIDLDKPDVSKAFFADVDGDGIADLFDRCYPVTNLTQCEEMLLGSENGTNSTTDDGETTGTTDNSQDDTRDSAASSQSLFDNPSALIIGFLAGGLMMAVVGPSLIGRKEEDDDGL